MTEISLKELREAAVEAAQFYAIERDYAPAPEEVLALVEAVEAVFAYRAALTTLPSRVPGKPMALDFRPQQRAARSLDSALSRFKDFADTDDNEGGT